MIACIDVLKSIRCLRGRKHLAYLPVRGQRNRTNARTRKNIYLGIDDRKNKKKKKFDLSKIASQNASIKKNVKNSKNASKKVGKKITNKK